MLLGFERVGARLGAYKQLVGVDKEDGLEVVVLQARVVVRLGLVRVLVRCILTSFE